MGKIGPGDLDELSGIEQHELTRIYQESDDELAELLNQYYRDRDALLEKTKGRIESYIKNHGRNPDTASNLLIEIGRRETKRKADSKQA